MIKVNNKVLVFIIFITYINIFSYSHSASFIKKNPPKIVQKEGAVLTYNFKTRSYENTEVEKFYSGRYIDAYFDPVYSFDETEVTGYITKFEEEIIPLLNRTIFVIPYEKIDIVFYDVKDFYGEQNQDYYAGYFDSDYKENQKTLFLDINPGLVIKDFDSFASVASHELQHLVHFFYDQNEETWLNEGLSELTTYLCGFENNSHVEKYIEFPFISLNTWNNSLVDYGKVYLFFRYLNYRKGTGLIRKILRSGENGLESIIELINKYEFNDFFKEWAVAMSIDDKEQLKYDIIGFDFNIVPLDIFKDKDIKRSINIEKYSFFKFRGYRSDISNKGFNFKCDSLDMDYIAVFFENNKVVDQIDISEDGYYVPKNPYNNYVLVVCNVSDENIQCDFSIEWKFPEVKELKNPYFDFNRLFAIKGKVENITFNEQTVVPVKYNDNLSFFSLDIELFDDNILEFDYTIADKKERAYIKYKNGTI